MNHHTVDEDLPPEEAAAFAALSRETRGSADLAEERTVGALRTAGLLRDHGGRHTRRVTRIVIGIAAGLVIFATGAFVGHLFGAREVRAISPSVQVQEAGTAYVAALVRLSRAPDAERTPGVEAGAATLRAAATSLALVNPADPVALRIRTSLDNVNHPAGDRSVIWF